MSSSDTSSLRLDHTQISLLTAPQNDSLTHIQNLFHVTFHLTTDGSNTLNITGNNHNQAAEAVKELLDSKSDMDDQTLQFGSTDSVNPHAALFHDESENNMEHVHVDVTEIPLDDQERLEVVDPEEDDLSESHEENGADQHEDMWDSVEVDSEFEDLSEEDIYADMDVDLETVDEKQDGPEQTESNFNDSQAGQSRQHRYQTSHDGHIHKEASQSLINALTPFVGKDAMQIGHSDEEDDYVSDEEEAAYETQVERYNRYRQLNESQRTANMDVDSDESDDDEDEDQLNRPARTRRPRKTPAMKSPPSKGQASNSTASQGVKKKRRSGGRSYSDDDEDFEVGVSRPSSRLRERDKVKPVSDVSNDVEKLRETLTHEFDIALSAKQKELQMIEERMEETRIIWERLQHVWSSRTWEESVVAPRVQAVQEFRNSKKRGRPVKRELLKTSRQLKEQTEVLEAAARKLDGPPKKRKKYEGVARPLYVLTPSRGFVRVICPECDRDVFGTHLGFINHCRLVHMVKFASWDDAVELCGQPVDESVVPLNDPSRTESTSLSFSISMQKNEARLQQHRFRPDAPPFPSTPGGIPHSEATSHATPIRGGVTIDHSHQPQTIKKHVILGNSYKCLSRGQVRAEDETEALWMRPANDLTPPTHRWMVYVRPVGNEDLLQYISKVRFFLHPAFKPRHIVEVTQPPFQLIRESAHAWPVRVQIFFSNSSTKPMSFVHYIVLHQSAVESVGEEYYIDLEFERDGLSGNTAESEITSPGLSSPVSATAAAHSSNRNASYTHHSTPNAAAQHNPAGSSANLGSADTYAPGAPHFTNAPQDAGYTAPGATGQHGGLLEPTITYEMLVEFVRHTATTVCPLVTDDETLILPYSVAKSLAEWRSWAYGKRKSSEWQRALRLSRLLFERYQVKRTTRELLDLCKHLNLTPLGDEPWNQPHPSGTEPLIPGDPASPQIPVLSNYSRSYVLPGIRDRLERMEVGDSSQFIQFVRFCRYCGSCHLPMDRIDELEIACGEKKLLVLQESHSTFRELLERSIRQVREFNQPEQRIALALQSQLQHPEFAPPQAVIQPEEAQPPQQPQEPQQPQQQDSSSSSSSSALPATENMDVPPPSPPPSPLPPPQQSLQIDQVHTINDSVTNANPAQNLPLEALAPPQGPAVVIETEEREMIVVDDEPIPPEKLEELREAPSKPSKSSTRPHKKSTKVPKPPKPRIRNRKASANNSTQQAGRGRPIKLRPDGVLASLLAAEQSSAPPPPSAITEPVIIPANWRIGDLTENPETWTLEALCALDPAEFITFMTYIPPSQHVLLPNLPVERLMILTDFLAKSSTPQPSAPESHDPALAHPHQDFTPSEPTYYHYDDANGNGSAMDVDVIHIDDEHPEQAIDHRPQNHIPPKSVPKRTTQSPSTRLPKLGLHAKNSRLGANFPAAAASSSPAADSHPHIMEISDDASMEHGDGHSDHVPALEASMDGCAHTESHDITQEPQSMDTSNAVASNEATENGAIGWTPAQEAILIAYFQEHPDQVNSPLPPHILEALFQASVPAAPAPAPAPAAQTVAQPATQPARRYKKTKAQPPSAQAPAPALAPIQTHAHAHTQTYAHVHAPQVVANNGSAMAPPAAVPAITEALLKVSKRPEYELLRSTKYDFEFRRAEGPDPNAQPAMQELLETFQLDHATSNHANMIFLKLMASFSRRLLFSTAEAFAAEKATEQKSEARLKVVVPLHVATAIVRAPQHYDFLTDEGLARYNSLEMIEANALTDDPSAQEILAQLEPRLAILRAMAADDEVHRTAQEDAAKKSGDLTHTVPPKP